MQEQKELVEFEIKAANDCVLHGSSVVFVLALFIMIEPVNHSCRVVFSVEKPSIVVESFVD